MNFKTPPFNFDFSADAIEALWDDFLAWDAQVRSNDLPPFLHLYARHMREAYDAEYVFRYYQKEDFILCLFELGFFNLDYLIANNLCWGIER